MSMTSCYKFSKRSHYSKYILYILHNVSPPFTLRMQVGNHNFVALCPYKIIMDNYYDGFEYPFFIISSTMNSFSKRAYIPCNLSNYGRESTLRMRHYILVASIKAMRYKIAQAISCHEWHSSLWSAIIIQDLSFNLHDACDLAQGWRQASSNKSLHGGCDTDRGVKVKSL